MQAGSRFRTDIQALRGFAVLVVLLYHAGLDLLPAGFLGVDIFFVLSGFLITRLVADALAAGRFSFADFYYRRARRLLPAAYVTLLATIVAAPLLLTRSELLDFRDQVAGAVTFSANMVLWKQSGYFAGEAELKPLLHVWSLSIEEQYYLLLPALLALLPRRYWLAALVAASGLSLALCLRFADEGAGAFYLLPTRAWELGLGSLGALLGASPRLSPLVRAAFWPGLVLMLVLPFLPLVGPHPGPVALATCVATLLVVLRQHPLLGRGPLLAAMSRLGDISYSLYLVHWPLFAFAHNLWIEEGGQEAPLAVRLGLVGLSLLLAWLLHRHVEEPARYREFGSRRRVVAGLVAGGAVLVLLASLLAALQHAPRDYESLRKPNYGFGPGCSSLSPFGARPGCRNSARPGVLVWGDSFAMHLVPGLVAGPDPLPLAQATASVCGPLLGVAPLQPDRGYGPDWARACLRFNDSVLRWLAATPSVHTVVLSSPFTAYVTPGLQLLRANGAAGPAVVPAGEAEALAGLQRTVVAVRRLGRKVVVVGPPPSSGFDSSRCHERVQSDMPVLGVAADCSIDEAEFQEYREPVLELLAEVPRAADVGVMRFEPYLCRSGRCRTRVGETLLYRDRGHLSREGAIRLARDMAWRQQLARLAR